MLAYSTKLGREHLVRFAPVEEVDVLATESGSDAELLGELEDQGLEVVVA